MTACGIAAPPSGQVPGIIRVERDKPLAGALLTAVRTLGPSGHPLQQPAYTNRPADGRFVFGVKSGTAVHVRVDDDADSMHNRQKSDESVGLLIGVSTPQGMFHHAPVVLDDKLGLIYRLVAPSETPVKRLAARRGAKRAVMAVAHTMLIIGYHMVKTGRPDHELGGNYLEQINKDQLQRCFVKRLQRLGLTVTVETVPEAA